MSVHHRKPRGMGGTVDIKINSASNLMAVCGSGTTGCHGWLESHREDAYRKGWLVHRNDDPEKVSVEVRQEMQIAYVYLNDDATYSPVET